ncbi:hypothetical protein [Paracoccus aminophilus]|uniref:Lipoprotein n=1 Tax=Paracoccus aminophilus JCM 7686 TaxID=1367847 RepID=S5XZJ3_PARAH|nr:hypothetical protein [Paracoccus aminophilus]AGT08865.1 hypothetical protein JCM7686_1764 [Paracoccus aminophilus JCM 7686]
MRQLLILLPLALAACAEPMIADSDVIRTARDPAYSYGEGGGVVPSSCRGGASRYSGTPSGCQRDLVFAAQAVNPGDLVEPGVPGPGPAGPVGRAADRYIDPQAALPINSGTTPRQQATPRRISTLPQSAIPSDPYGEVVN